MRVDIVTKYFTSSNLSSRSKNTAYILNQALVKWENSNGFDCIDAIFSAMILRCTDRKIFAELLSKSAATTFSVTKIKKETDMINDI